LIGIRVPPKTEDIGLDISEHAEMAYSDGDELMGHGHNQPSSGQHFGPGSDGDEAA
jgi:hypothetical protein